MNKIFTKISLLGLIISSGFIPSCNLFNHEVLMNSITLNSEEYNLTLYEKINAVATFEPLDCENQAFTWLIADNQIASITPYGNTCEIEGLKEGSTKLKVINERSGVLKEVDVNVTHIPLPTLKPIIDIENETNVSVLGQVIFVTENEFLIKDNTGIIRIKNYNYEIEKGNKYLVSGDVIADKASLVFNNPNIALYEKDNFEENNFFSYFNKDAYNTVSQKKVFDIRKIISEGIIRKSKEQFYIQLDNFKIYINSESEDVISNYRGKECIIYGYLYNCDINSNCYYVDLVKIIEANKGELYELENNDIELEFNKPNLSYNSFYEINIDYKNVDLNYDKKVRYQIENNSIVCIDDSNILYCKNVGETKITIQFDNNISKEIEIYVNNTNSISPTSFEFSQEIYEGTISDNIDFSFNYYPRRSCINLVENIYLENENIGSISGNQLTINNYGETIIHAVTENGLEATAKLVGIDLPFDDGYSSIEYKVYYQTTLPIFSDFDELSDFYSEALLRYYNKVEYYLTFELDFENDDTYYKFVFANELTSTVAISAYCNGKVGDYYHYGTIFYYPEVGPSIIAETSSAYNFLNIENLVTSYRENAIINSEYRRNSSFDNFKIYENNKGEIDVYTTEGLWLALEHDYIPNFVVKHSKAEKYFNYAKNILRTIITEDMNDLQKSRCIYDFICENYNYDYDGLHNTCEGFEDYKQFIDGAFDYGKVVCDGFAKIFVLLASLEGIKCLRICGANLNPNDAGHAWNYIKINDYWYSTCTTWGQINTNSFNSYTNRPVDYTDYEYFLNNLNFFKDYFYLSQSIDLVSDEKANYYYDNIFKEEKIGNKSTYVQSEDDFLYVMDKLYKSRKTKYSFATIAFDTSILDSNINKYINKLEKDQNTKIYIRKYVSRRGYKIVEIFYMTK